MLEAERGSAVARASASRALTAATTCSGVACFAAVGVSPQKPRALMMSAGVCNDVRYKPDLGECATASVRWAEANIGEQEIKRRLKVANCSQP